MTKVSRTSAILVRSIACALLLLAGAAPATASEGGDEGVCINCFNGYLGPSCGPSGNASGINCRIETTSRCFLGICVETDTCRVDPGPQNCSPPPGTIPDGLDAETYSSALAVDGSLATTVSSVGSADDRITDCRGRIIARVVSIETIERVRSMTSAIRL